MPTSPWSSAKTTVRSPPPPTARKCRSPGPDECVPRRASSLAQHREVHRRVDTSVSPRVFALPLEVRFRQLRFLEVRFRQLRFLADGPPPARARLFHVARRLPDVAQVQQRFQTLRVLDQRLLVELHGFVGPAELLA